MKAVFDTRAGSGYVDTVERYQFPARYLREVTATVGDWVVYYEPSREGGRRAYIAAATVIGVERDDTRSGHHRAIMGDYLAFDAPVALRGPNGYLERRLRDVVDPSAVGRALQGRSVRELPEADFAAIVAAGISDTLAPENAIRLNLARPDAELRALLTEPPDPRTVERLLTNRIVRDASFRRVVLAAYDDRCAVTGLRIVNGGGKAEVQAAHVLPVADGGPDIVQNGIALSSTVHWLFDRHLITLTDDLGLLVSHNKVPSELRPLFERQLSRIRLPTDRRLWPNLAYVRRHRERFMGG